MNDNTEAESADENQQLPVSTGPSPPGSGEVWKIQQRGGHFVGVAGWSGLLFWLIAKFLSFLTSGLVWAVIVAIVWIAVDETVRIRVRSLLGDDSKTPVADNESRKFPFVGSEAYQQLPTMWKQLLAEVQVNQANYPPRFVSIMRELTQSDITVLDHIAPYVVGNFIVKADDFEMGYDIPSVTDMDFDRLNTIGITTEGGQFGLNQVITPKDGRPAESLFGGTTLALLVRAPEPAMDFNVHVISLTEEGAQIIRLLDKPTSLQALCKVGSRLRQRKKLETLILANFESDREGGAWANSEEMTNVSGLCSRFGVPLVD